MPSIWRPRLKTRLQETKKHTFSGDKHHPNSFEESNKQPPNDNTTSRRRERSCSDCALQIIRARSLAEFACSWGLTKVCKIEVQTNFALNGNRHSLNYWPFCMWHDLHVWRQPWPAELRNWQLCFWQRTPRFNTPWDQNSVGMEKGSPVSSRASAAINVRSTSTMGATDLTMGLPLGLGVAATLAATGGPRGAAKRKASGVFPVLLSGLNSAAAAAAAAAVSSPTANSSSSSSKAGGLPGTAARIHGFIHASFLATWITFGILHK